MSQWYYTPARIACCLPTYPSSCLQSCLEQGDMKHISWTCPKVKRLWIQVYAMVNTILHKSLQNNPWEALLHQPIENVTCHEQTLITHIFIATKQTIERAWKLQILCIDEVKHYTQSTMNNEKLTAILNNTHDKCLRTWQPWLDYFPLSQLTVSILELWLYATYYAMIAQASGLFSPSSLLYPSLHSPFLSCSCFALLSSPFFFFSFFSLVDFF